MRFCRRRQNVETVRQFADNFAQNHKERKAAVRCSYDARLRQDGHTKFARLSQDNAVRRTVPALQPCGHCVIFSCSHMFRRILATTLQQSARLSCGSLAHFVRQMRGWQTITSVIQTPCVSCSSLAAALCVLQLSCVLQKMHKNRKENKHVESLVFDVAAALGPCFFVRQSCGVAHNTVRLPQETQKFFVADRCTAAVRLMSNGLNLF